MSSLPDQEYERIKAQGYTLAREHFPWGKCEMYKNHDTKHCLYYFDGKLREWSEVSAILKGDWHPLTYEDQAWKRYNVQ